MRGPGRVLVATLLFLAVAHRAIAFQLAEIDEVMSGYQNDPLAEYVEIRMLASRQTDVSHTRLYVFGCDGTTVTPLVTDAPHDLAFDGTDVRWSMATARFAELSGVVPDFTFPSQGFPNDCGMVCWGAPVPIPPTWAASDPDNYVDCVAYGPYTGTLQTSDGGPTALSTGDGMSLSLQRVSNTNDDAADFRLLPVTPTNNALSAAAVTTTTVSSPTTTSATTTTFPSDIARGVGIRGAGLTLKASARKPGKRAIVLVAKDAKIALADDPTTGGASLRVSTDAGDRFDATYALAATKWKRIGKASAPKGYRFVDGSGPIKSVLVRAGRVKAVGKGAQLVQSLHADPDPVRITLVLGGSRYCTSFAGGTFAADKRYVARSGSPVACP